MTNWTWEWLKDYQVLVAASLAFTGTLYIIKNNNANARKKNASDIVNALNDDPLFQEGDRAILDVANNPGYNLTALSSKQLADDQQETKNKLLYVLNRYEYLCVGILNNTYDEEIAKRSICYVMVRAYNTCKPLIDAIRSAENRPAFYSELERVAKKWEDNPLQSITKSRRRDRLKSLAKLLPW